METGPSSPKVSAKDKLLDAALSLIRAKGYAATTIEDLCTAAGVTKGAFFHHFASKEALGVAAAAHWSVTTGALFATAPYHDHAEPLDRVLAYVDFRRDLLAGELAAVTCLAGTMVQEVYDASPAIRDACAASIFGHTATLEADIALAMTSLEIAPSWTAESLARHTQAVLQGAFVLAKAKGDVAVAADSVDHLKRYIELLFENAAKKGEDA